MAISVHPHPGFEQLHIEPYIATGRNRIIKIGIPFSGRSLNHRRTSQSEVQDGLQTADQDWSGHLPLAQVYGPNHHRNYQGDPGLPTFSLRAWLQLQAKVPGCLAFNLKRMHTCTSKRALLARQ